MPRASNARGTPRFLAPLFPPAPHAPLEARPAFEARADDDGAVAQLLQSGDFQVLDDAVAPVRVGAQAVADFADNGDYCVDILAVADAVIEHGV